MERPTQNHTRPETIILSISHYGGGIFGKATTVSTVYWQLATCHSDITLDVFILQNSLNVAGDC